MATAVYHTKRPTLFASTFHSAADHSSSHNYADPYHPPTLQQPASVSKMTLIGVASVDAQSGTAASLPEEGCPIEKASDDIKEPSNIHKTKESNRTQDRPPTPKRQASTSETSTKSSRYVAKLEDFQLIRVLGKGCAGKVLLVKHAQTHTIHAMKAISKRSVLTHDELKHTMTEASILRRIAVQEPYNRFVSKLHCSFTDQENFYFVMEFCPGGDLATQMEIYGILGDHRTRFYASDITQGLEDLHRHGIIVRDLKPENILLNAKGHAVLADFGLSKEFAYRGDPKPIHVVTYPGQKELPVWAGKGAGSYRPQASGGGKLVVDKAYSFVGTSEYLSPEVVKRGDYSYAVDWWALGCIIFEGLMGRVPFRKRDEDPPMVLWNKILYDPWDDCFGDPKLAKYALDQTAYKFIDSLLQKDPMRRITEPYVKQHEYFSMIDWGTVQRGEYQDPHGLHIHPTAEYNTRYFPKLCLQEDPSVDMSTHDLRDYEVGGGKRTPMNDNALYKLELVRYRKELEGFAWSRDWDTMWDGEEESEMESGVESFIEESVIEQGREVRDEADGLNDRPADHEGDAFNQNLTPATSGGLSVPVDYPDPSKSKSLLVPPTSSPENTPVVPMLSLPSTTSEFDAATSSPAATFGLPTPAAEGLFNPILSAQPKDTEENGQDEVETPFVELAPKQLESQGIEISIATKDKTQMVKDAEVMSEEPIIAQAKQLENLPTDMKSATGIQDDFKAMNITEKLSSSFKSLSCLASSNEELIPLVPPPPVPTSVIPPPVPAQPVSILDSFPSQTMTNPHPLSTAVFDTLNLPTDLPLSGLSVSDVISVPSLRAGHASPRLVRRHLHREGEISIPLARLSVELHGTITRLEDEGWEELATNKENIPTAPNGGPGAPYFFRSFTGLRRKPSTLVSSSLRRQYGPDSDTSSRGSSVSPTKSGRTDLKERKLFGGRRSIESTKRALRSLKTFPRLKSLTQEWGKDKTGVAGPVSPLLSLPSSAPHRSNLRVSSEGNSSDVLGRKAQMTSSDNARRHTESGWIDRHLKRTKPSSAPALQSRVISSSTSNTGNRSDSDEQRGAVSMAEGQVTAPRLELEESKPVVWGF
ncbi:AGC-group protein kinase [Cryptococcus neoformans]|nr:AGC-group protein kinase [Cryptococcus neoformans var. grubii]OXC61198.1 AGC-group protein kinase [Cryptococcus neoformans var. grubii MW-RSA852]